MCVHLLGPLLGPLLGDVFGVGTRARVTRQNTTDIPNTVTERLHHRV